MTEPHDVAVLLAEAAAFLVRWKSDPYDCALVGGLAAALRESDTELRSIDNVLARRPALADCRSRGEAVEKAISVASKADLLERQLADAQALCNRWIEAAIKSASTLNVAFDPMNPDGWMAAQAFHVQSKRKALVDAQAALALAEWKLAMRENASAHPWSEADYDSQSRYKNLPPRPAPKEATV